MTRIAITTAWTKFNKDSIVGLLHLCLDKTAEVINFCNSFEDYEDFYNGCTVDIYELDGDGEDGNESVKFSVEFILNYSEEIDFRFRGYYIREKYLLKTINGDIIDTETSSIGLWYPLLERNYDMDNFDDKEFLKGYLPIETEEIDLYKVWTQDLGFKIEYKPDEYRM